MSIQSDLFPDSRLVVQGVIYLASLASAHFLIIRPSLRLHNERKKRTSGAIQNVKGNEVKAQALQNQYELELRSQHEVARKIKDEELFAGQTEAGEIVARAQTKARSFKEKALQDLEANIADEKAKLPSLVDGISKVILSQLGVAKLFVFALIASAYSFVAVAAEPGHGPVDFMSGIFWPYFQFFVFVAAIIFFARKPMARLLEGQRNRMRTQLSEAKEALEMSNRRTAEFELKISGLQNEIQELKEQYTIEAAAERVKMVSEAERVANQIILDSERAAKELVLKTKEQLKKDLLDMAIKSVESQLTPEKLNAVDAQLKQDTMSSLSKIH